MIKRSVDGCVRRFYSKVPTAVDELVNDSFKPLLHYARLKDMKHYQMVEESYKMGSFIATVLKKER